MIRWIVFSTLSMGLFYGLYCLTLRRDRRLELSRWYLLLTLAFSIVFPFFSLPERVATASRTLVPDGDYAMMLDEVEITATPASHAIGLTDIYLVGLMVCTVYLLFQMVVQALTVVRLRRRERVYRADDGFAIPRCAALIMPDDDTAPYSFFNQIVVGTRGLGDGELRCILAHESYHVGRFHTCDLVVARLMCCLAWYNPFAWLLLRELRAVHEFQADAASIGTCGRDDYLRLLYRQATGVGYGHITNNFQSINLKKRIAMMKIKKTRYGAWKLLAVLPVAAMLMLVGCKQTAAEPSDAAADEAVATTPIADEAICETPEVDPEFPGGVEALHKHVAENIRYPQEAKDNNIAGRVVVGFVVMEDGSIANVEVLRGIGGGCDEEAVRVVKTMPKWKAALDGGKPVKVRYVLPINFVL